MKPGETRKNPAKPGETPRKSTAPTRMDQQIRDNPPAKPGAPRDAPDLVPGLPPGQNLALRTASRGTRDHQLGTRGPPAPPSGGCPRPVPGLILGSQACPDPPSGGVPRPPRPNSRPNSVSQACPDPPLRGGDPPLRGGSQAALGAPETPWNLWDLFTNSDKFAFLETPETLYKRVSLKIFGVKTRKHRLN